MTTLQAYIPIDRRLALAAGKALPDRARGAALFADISGFTPLTAALATELGPRLGAEALVNELDRVFAPLVAVVHAAGGAAVNFSGDSVTCWFDDARLEGKAVEQAIACGLRLQETMRSLQSVHTSGRTTIPLGLKIAIAAGPVRRFMAGSSESYVLDVLAGATLDDMSAAEQRAEPGEVLVAAGALERPAIEATVAEWREYDGRRFALVTEPAPLLRSQTWPRARDLTDAEARPWLLPPVYTHLSQGSDAFLADLRPCTSMFVSFSGIDYDGDDQAGEKLDRTIRRIQDILNRYEGFLQQITIGDKGGYLHVSIGAPVSHEDNAARAAAAAIDIRRLVASTSYLEPAQIGIGQGLVYSGAYGHPDRRAYSVMGSEVNIAARLMVAAEPGQILVSGQAAGAIDREFDLRGLGPIPLKGVTSPFPVWELQRRRPLQRVPVTGGSARRMVGRQDERENVGRLLAGLARAESSLLFVEGQAGIGKSMLVSELLQQAQESDSLPPDTFAPLVVVGSGDAIERSTPYYAWRPIFRQLLGPDETDPDAPVDPDKRGQIIEMLGDDVRHLAPLLNTVIPLDLPETELTEQITGEARQDATQQLLLELMRKATGTRPVILVIDDAHWLDSASWTLVRRVQRGVRPLLLVLVARPMDDDAPVIYRELKTLPATHSIALDVLPPAAVAALAARRLNVDQLPPEVNELILARAEGHPFFSEELALALRDGGYLVVRDGRARLATSAANLESLDFPNSIQGVITSRIDYLSPRDQLTVKVASVIGRVFAYRVLRDIYPAATQDAQLLESLDHLERLDITPLENPEPNLSYIFRHILTQEVVYGLMTQTQKRQLHRETALWYEADGDGDPGRRYPLVAHHWQMAGEREKAMTYYALAGENAFHEFANPEAVRFLSAALELRGSAAATVQLARWHRLLAEAHYRLSHVDESRNHYEAALRILGRPVPSSTLGQGVGLGGELLRQVALRLRPRRADAKPAEEREVALETARVFEGISELYYNTGDPVASFYCVMSALNEAEYGGPSPELARSYANMCATLGIVSLNSLAESYGRRALTMATSIDELATQAWIQIPLATYRLWIGDWDRAQEATGVALDIYARLGEWRRWGVAAWLLPQVAQSRGDLSGARAQWRELYDVAVRHADTRHQVRSQGGQFFNFLSLGQIDEAYASADAVGFLLADDPEMLALEERLWYAMRAVRALRDEDWGAAVDIAGELVEAIDRARFKFDLIDVFAAPVEVMLALQEQGIVGPAEVKKCLQILNSYARSYRFAQPRALRAAGRADWLAGNSRRATKRWESSLAAARELGMPYEEALTLHVMGKALDDGESLALAWKLLDELGAPEPNAYPG